MNITEYAILKKMLGKGGGGGDTPVVLCKVELWDDEGAGPFNITYKSFENGSIVDKAEVTDGDYIFPIQNTEIYVATPIYPYVFEDAYGVTDLVVEYVDGGAYITVPEVAECTIWIHS